MAKACMYRKRNMLLIAVCAVPFILMYWHGSMSHMQTVNTNINKSDQFAYYKYTKRMHGRIFSNVTSNYPITHDGARTIAYPALQLLVFKQGITPAEFFLRAQYLSVILSIILLIGIGIIFVRTLPTITAITLLSITTFTVFLFKSTYTKPELLFYALFFICFLLMKQMLRKPTKRVAVLTGSTVAITLLTKYSILPAFAFFLICYGYKTITDTYNSHTSSQKLLAKTLFDHAKMLGITILTFTVITSFHMYENKQKFGVLFYNVNTQFYVWSDSFEQAVQLKHTYGDRIGWPTLAQDELPSMRKYLSENSVQQIVGRFTSNAEKLHQKAGTSFGWYKYVLLLSSITMILAITNLQEAYKIITTNKLTTTFSTILFGSYILMSFWFLPIGFGVRHVLTIFLPYMYTLSLVCTFLSREKSHRTFLNATCILLLLLLAAELPDILLHRIVTMRAGG